MRKCVHQQACGQVSVDGTNKTWEHYQRGKKRHLMCKAGTPVANMMVSIPVHTAAHSIIINYRKKLPRVFHKNLNFIG